MLVNDENANKQLVPVCGYKLFKCSFYEWQMDNENKWTWKVI